MALIKCPDCQKEISSKAKECPHCKYSFKQENTFICSECLTDIKNYMEICPICGYPIKESLKKKKKKKYAIYLVIVLLFAVVLYFPASAIYNSNKSKQLMQEAIDIANSTKLNSYYTINTASMSEKANDSGGVPDMHYLTLMFTPNAISLVKNSDYVYEEFGWRAKQVDDVLYYVDYSYVVEANVGSNKIHRIAFEVNMNTKKSLYINKTKRLLTKYRELGYIKNDDILSNYDYLFQ